MGNGVGNALLHATAALAIAGVTAGCDIVQGFQNAGDALFPPQKTYLETPGFRLTEGGFQRLNVGVGDELYLLARSVEDTEPALYAMRYLDPQPCRIPGVVRYWSSGLPSEHPAQILYFEADVRRGTLHFADARCNIHDLVLEDAELPLQESSLGLLIPAGSDLLLVDPPTGGIHRITGGVQALYLNGPGAHFILVDGALEAYDTNSWQYIGRAGQNVAGVRGVGGSFLFEDPNGFHRITVSGTPGNRQLSTETIDRDGCRLGWVSGGVLAYYSPCAEARLALWDSSSNRTIRPDWVADPVYLSLELDPDANPLDARLDRDYWMYTLRDPLPEGIGRLVARKPSGEELVLGELARLDRATLDDSGDYGLALIELSGETGRLVRWSPEDGAAETLATGVLYGSSEIIADWNGAVGNRVRLTNDGEVVPLLEGVPRRDYVYQDQSRRWRAVFDESDGISGTLSIEDVASSDFAGKHVIARRVRHPRHEFLDVVLPGIAYVADHDPLTDTGRLEYNNLELGFRGIVSEGVADFIPAGNGILYTVPRGSARGIWIARAQ